MRKVSFYLIVFLFTTGFFKSTLEKCADYHFEMSNYLPRAEFKIVKILEAEYNRRYNEWLEKKEKWNRTKYLRKQNWEKKPYCKTFNFDIGRKCRNVGERYNPPAFYPYPAPSNTMTVKVRDFSDKEIKKNLDKFLRQSLKVKLRLADQGKIGGQGYLNVYKDCVRFKEKNFQLFKDKYN